MKHLKSKEEYLHGGSYTRIDDETFIFDKESLRSKRASETTNSDMEFRKYFKCDGFDGLQSLVELWISRTGNLKSRDIK